MIFRAATLTVGQLADPVFRGVVIKSVLFTLCLFAGLTALFYFAVPEVTYFESDWLQWLNSVIEAGSALAFFAVLVLTFSTLPKRWKCATTPATRQAGRRIFPRHSGFPSALSA